MLGSYVRDEKVLPLEEAIRKLTSLPATNLKIRERGLLKEGCSPTWSSSIPRRIPDHATFDKPHQYATGVQHVFVNGVQVSRTASPPEPAGPRGVGAGQEEPDRQLTLKR